MFTKSKFKGNIDNWNVKKETKKYPMFWRSPLEKRIPKWFKFRSSGWLVKKYKEESNLNSIIEYAFESIECATGQKINIEIDMLEPYIKDFIIKDCQKNDIGTDDLQIEGAASRLIKYLNTICCLFEIFRDRTVLWPIARHAIKSILYSENKETTGQITNITIGMIEPYINEAVKKYCQENYIIADDNQIRWVSIDLAKTLNVEDVQKEKEKAEQAKIKQMLTSDAEDNQAST
jgi:hypothetical protein